MMHALVLCGYALGPKKQLIISVTQPVGSGTIDGINTPFAVRIRVVTMQEAVEQRVNIMAVVWRHVASYNVYSLTVDAVSRAHCCCVVGK